MATSQPKIRTFVEIQTPDGKKYYVEPSTKFSTYTFPADAVIFSNVTKQIIYRPPGMNVNVKQHGDPAQCQPQQQGQLGSPPNPNPQQQPHPGQQQQQLTQQQQQAYMQQMRQQQQPGQPGVTPSPNPQQSQQLGQPGQPSPQQHLQSGQQQQQQPHPGQQQQQLTPQQQAYMQQMRMRQMQQQQMQQQQMQQQQMQQQQMQQQQMQQQQMQQQQMRQPQSGHQQQQLTPQQQAYMQQMRMRHMQQQQMQQQQMRQPQSGQQQQQLTPQQQAYMQQMRMRQMQQQQMQQPKQPAFPAQQPPPPASPSQQPPPPPFPVQAPPPPQQPTPTPSQQQPQQQAPPLPTGGAPSPPPPPPSLPPAGLASAQGGASLPPPTPPVSGDADPQQVPQQAPPPDILPPHIDSGAPQSPQPRPNQQSVNQRRPNSTNQNMLNSTNQRPNSINQGRPRSTTQGSRVLEPPYCGPPPFKLSQTHIPKTKELIQRYVPLILNMDLYFPPRRGHALYKNNSDPNLIGGSHSRHKSGELEFINLISETISYKSSDASEAEVNQLEEIASSPPPTPPSSAAEEQPSLPTPASEEQPSSPPPASEEQPSSPPPASEEQPSPPPPASEEQPSSPPPASEEQPSSPPPASEEQPSPPSSAAEEQPSLPTPATEEQPSSSPPAAEEQPSLPPPSTEEQPSPPSSAAEEPPPPHPPALAPAPKPKKPKPTKPTKPKHTETKEEIMSDGTKVQYIIEYEEEEEEEEAEEPTPDPAPTPEPAPTPDPEPTPEPAPAPAPVPKMFQKQEEPEIVLEEFKEEEECHEYAPVTFKATIDIKELVSMHFNLARSSNHDTIMNLCNAYSFEEFGKLNFRKFHVKGKFLRSEPIEALITYNEEPLYKPLLASVDESKKDLGNQISLAILTLDSQKVVRIINSDPTLIDEVYAQLIKYTSNCPNEDIAIKGWMTFLLISTLFAPTDLIRNYVISHMYKNFKNESCAIKMLAKFSFIRLKERICIGVNRHEEDSETMKLIPYACFYGLSMFHTSLYEIIWSQKKRFPKTPIPIPLYLICQALILLGLFRGKYPYLNSKPAGTNHKMFFTLIAYMPHSPVNLKNYALSNNGIDKEEKLKTVIDLLIYWLNTLTDSIIPASILDQFIELSEQNRFNAIIVLLPTVHFRTLEYLIGFLKHFLKYQKRTGMDIKKISEAFGPHIVVEPTRQLEEFQQRRVKKYAPMFCEYCLNFLDTSSLYPLNPEYITDKTKPQQPQLNA